MNTPVYFKLNAIHLVEVYEWISLNRLENDFTYEWSPHVVSFAHCDDAVAFSLKFQLPVYDRDIN
jgi:hypothetical protein